MSSTNTNSQYFDWTLQAKDKIGLYFNLPNPRDFLYLFKSLNVLIKISEKGMKDGKYKVYGVYDEKDLKNEKNRFLYAKSE
jgi:hypothetical protein